MPQFKEMKKSARGSLKKHYFVFVFMLVILTFICQGRSTTRQFTGYYNSQKAGASKVNSNAMSGDSQTITILDNMVKGDDAKNEKEKRITKIVAM